MARRPHPRQIPSAPTGFRPLDRSRATEFWVVRHGESTWNVDGRYQGQSDVPLSPLGVLQAASLAERLTGAHFDAVYSSDLLRALQTAGAVQERLSDPPVVRTDPRLREIDVGQLSGRRRAEIEREFPGYLQALAQNPWTAQRPGGESMSELASRSGQALTELHLRHPGQRLLVFTHGGVVRVAVSMALGGQPRHDWARLSVTNTSITRLLLDGQAGQLLTFNDAAHLEQLAEAAESDDILERQTP